MVTKPSGGIRVALLRPEGSDIPGFTLKDCPYIKGDFTGYEVVWNKKTSLRELHKKPVRLKFELKNADLYSYQFVANSLTSSADKK